MSHDIRKFTTPVAATFRKSVIKNQLIKGMLEMGYKCRDQHLLTDKGSDDFFQCYTIPSESLFLIVHGFAKEVEYIEDCTPELFKSIAAMSDNNGFEKGEILTENAYPGEAMEVFLGYQEPDQWNGYRRATKEEIIETFKGFPSGEFNEWLESLKSPEEGLTQEVKINYLDMAMRLSGLFVREKDIDLIISLYEGILEKGHNFDMKDIASVNALHSGRHADEIIKTEKESSK